LIQKQLDNVLKSGSIVTKPAQVLLVMWCSEGLECCVNITEIDKKIMWQTMKGEAATACLPNLNHMILRARFNPQRHYEIYTVNVDNTITAEDIVTMFDDSPQQIVDIIRKRGYKLYSDRAQSQREVIV